MPILRSLSVIGNLFSEIMLSRFRSYLRLSPKETLKTASSNDEFGERYITTSSTVANVAAVKAG